MSREVQIVVAGKNLSGRAFGEVRRDIQGVTDKINSLKRSIMYLAGGVGIGTFLVREFKKGIEAIDEFQTAAAGIAATLTSFMSDPNKSLAQNYAFFHQYAVKTQLDLELIAARAITTGRNLRKVYEVFAQHGQIPIGRADMMGLARIADAITILTAGQADAERQFYQESRSLLEGRVRPDSRLAMMLANRFGGNEAFRERLEAWKQEGTLIENVAKLLKGFVAANKDVLALSRTWTNSLETALDRLRRRAFAPLHLEFVNLQKQLFGLLLDFDKGGLTELGESLAKDLGGVAKGGFEALVGAVRFLIANRHAIIGVAKILIGVWAVSHILRWNRTMVAAITTGIRLWRQYGAAAAAAQGSRLGGLARGFGPGLLGGAAMLGAEVGLAVLVNWLFFQKNVNEEAQAAYDKYKSTTETLASINAKIKVQNDLFAQGNWAAAERLETLRKQREHWEALARAQATAAVQKIGEALQANLARAQQMISARTMLQNMAGKTGTFTVEGIPYTYDYRGAEWADLQKKNTEDLLRLYKLLVKQWTQITEAAAKGNLTMAQVAQLAPQFGPLVAMLERLKAIFGDLNKSAGDWFAMVFGNARALLQTLRLKGLQRAEAQRRTESASMAWWDTERGKHDPRYVLETNLKKVMKTAPLIWERHGFSGFPETYRALIEHFVGVYGKGGGRGGPSADVLQRQFETALRGFTQARVGTIQQLASAGIMAPGDYIRALKQRQAELTQQLAQQMGLKPGEAMTGLIAQLQTGKIPQDLQGLKNAQSLMKVAKDAAGVMEKLRRLRVQMTSDAISLMGPSQIRTELEVGKLTEERARKLKIIIDYAKYYGWTQEKILATQREIGAETERELQRTRDEARVKALQRRLDDQNWMKDLEGRLDRIRVQLEETSLAEGFNIGIRGMVRDLETMGQVGQRWAQDTARAMGDAFSNFFFDVIEKGVARLDQVFTEFFKSILRSMLQILSNRLAAYLLTSVMGWLGGGTGINPSVGNMSNVIGGAPYHLGGLIRAHSGLYLNPDEIPIIAQLGEWVINRNAVNKYGANTFDAYNRGAVPIVPLPTAGAAAGGSGPPQVQVNVQIVNKGGSQLKELERAVGPMTRVGPNQYEQVQKIVVDDITHGGPIRSALKGLQAGY